MQQKIESNNMDQNGTKILKRNNTRPNLDTCVIIRLACDFLYSHDVLNLMWSNSHFNVPLHRINFESNETMRNDRLKIIDCDLIQTYFFDLFFVVPWEKENKVFEKVEIEELRILNSFDKPLELYFKNIQKNKIRSIRMESNYNQELPRMLPSTLECIIFGSNYNKKLPETLPQSLKQLKFSNEYNQPLPNILPQNIEHIEFGIEYNQPFCNNLPNQLKSLKFGCCFDQPIEDQLPDSIEELQLGNLFNQSLKFKLPKSLKKITFLCQDWSCIKLPDNFPPLLNSNISNKANFCYKINKLNVFFEKRYIECILIQVSLVE